MRRTLAFLCLGLLAACAQPAPGSRAGSAGSAGGSTALAAQAARLPAEVAGFTRGETVSHEPARPGYGMTVSFAGPGQAALATVSLYDRAETLDDAVAEALRAASTRTAQTLTEQERRTLAVPGGDPVSCSRLEGTYGREGWQTVVCLGTAAGRMVKVQVSGAVRPVRPVDSEAFIIGVVRAARGA